MATFLGIDMGAAVESIAVAAPYARQLIEYPGVNGVGVNPLGSRGAHIHVNGVICGATPSILDANEEVWRRLQAGCAVGIYIDPFAAVWTGANLIAFEPQGPIGYAAGYGWARPYKMQFHILVY